MAANTVLFMQNGTSYDDMKLGKPCLQIIQREESSMNKKTIPDIHNSQFGFEKRQRRKIRGKQKNGERKRRKKE